MVHTGEALDVRGPTSERLTHLFNVLLQFTSDSPVYPRIRNGESVPDDLHLCTLNPGGFIETDDGAQISFDGGGYGLSRRDWYRLSATRIST